MIDRLKVESQAMPMNLWLPGQSAVVKMAGLRTASHPVVKWK